MILPFVFTAKLPLSANVIRPVILSISLKPKYPRHEQVLAQTQTEMHALHRPAHYLFERQERAAIPQVSGRNHYVVIIYFTHVIMKV